MTTTKVEQEAQCNFYILLMALKILQLHSSSCVNAMVLILGLLDAAFIRGWRLFQKSK